MMAGIAGRVWSFDELFAAGAAELGNIRYNERGRRGQAGGLYNFVFGRVAMLMCLSAWYAVRLRTSSQNGESMADKDKKDQPPPQPIREQEEQPHRYQKDVEHLSEQAPANPFRPIEYYTPEKPPPKKKGQ